MVCGISFIAILVPLHAYTQCTKDASAWLSELAAIEGSDAAIKEKIDRLSTVKEQLQECQPAKDSVFARIVHRLGDFYRLSGDFYRGIRLTNKALAINKANTPGAQRSYLTHSYYNLGFYNSLLGLPDQAHLYFDSCIEVGVKYPEKIFIALKAMERKAFMYFQEGDYEQGVRISHRGIALARSKNMPDYEALLLIQKAQCESQLDRPVEAGKNIRNAIEILTSNQLEPYLANAYSVYALVLRRQKQFNESVSYYTKAFELNLAQGNDEQAARDLHDLAFLYDKKLNNPKQSIARYSRALEVWKKLDDRYMQATTYNNVGQVSWRNGDFKSALKFYQKGLMAMPIQFHEPDIKTNPPAFKLASVTNEYIAASLLWNKGDSWLGMYKVEKDIRHLEHAIAAYRSGDRMVDKMRWNQQGEQSKLFWRQETKAWYANAVNASFLLGSPEDAFYFMEKSRAVLLNDKLSELGAKNQLPAHDAEKEKQLRLKVQAVEVSAAADPNNAMFVDELWRVRKDLIDFISQLEKRYPSYYTYKYDTTVFALADLQKHLAAGKQTWIELFNTKDSVFVLTVTGSDAKFHKISFEDHASQAKRILDLCSSKRSINSNFHEFRQLSHHYYNKIFKLLNISTRRVTVSHDEYFLPFDLLLTDSSDHTSYLIQKHAFSYAYSAAHVLRSRTKQKSADQALLAIAPVNYRSDLRLQDLQGADESLRKIRSLYHGTEVLAANAATKQTFLKQISSFEVVHLYSHAKADSLGEEPAIYLYDSALNLSELQNLPGLHTKLIVLFACNTGVGKTVKGEGIFSLARGFAAAGIPSTISALWEIDNRATYNLAELFFKSLASREPSDVALQTAKLEMISRKEYELPYYWAGAVIIGRADRYQSADKASFTLNYKYAILLAVIAFFTIILLILRKRKVSINGGKHAT